MTLLEPRIAAVVFDMDGTLLDSLAVQLESYRRAIVESGGRDRPHDEILRAFSVGTAAAMLDALIERPVGPDAVARYEIHRREGASTVRPYAGVTETDRDADVVVSTPDELVRLLIGGAA